MEGLPDDVLLTAPDLSIGGSGGVLDALCKKMMADIHRSHEMSPEERDKELQSLMVPIPGPPSGRTLQLLQDPRGAFAAGTGAVVWPAALALIGLLDREVGIGSGLSAVELGAGLGSVGLFLALYKALRVVITDVPVALPLIERNISMNFSGGVGPRALPLRWGNREDLKALGSFDLVVGSDVTYRPDCMDDLLASVHDLLGPGGRAFLSLQDRPGEATGLEEAVARCPLLSLVWSGEVQQRSDALAEGSSVCDGDAEEVRVRLYELARKPEADAGLGDRVPTSAEEVEAEFERLTGIKPERMVPAGTWAQPHRAPQVASVPKASLKERITSDLIRHGLGDYLDGTGKELPSKLAMMEQARPEAGCMADVCQTAASGQAAEDLAWENACSRHEKKSQAGDAASQAAGCGPPPAKCAAPPTTEASAQDGSATGTSGSGSGAEAAGIEAEVCLNGLTWQVDVDEAKSELSAVVSFGEEVWRALHGPDEDASRDTAAFRQAVDFELADKELQVLHAGTAVLRLRLQRPVDPHAAAAKMCSRRRRVTVRAPLRRVG